MFSIPLSRKSIKINNLKYQNGFKLKVIPELSLIRKTGDEYILYSPLNLRIYILSKNEYDKLHSDNLDHDERKLFFENDLLTLKNIDPFQKSDNKYVEPIIFFTNKCNLKCLYCFSKGGELSIDNSFERIKALIDFSKNSLGDYKKGKIMFFSSGEPTLVYGLLKKTYRYINRILKKKIETSLISNGTFPKSVADWIIRNGIELQISCDGPPYIQDFQRPVKDGSKSSKIVENDIKYFVKRGYKNFNTHAVITRYSVNKMDEILNYFHRLGVSRVTFADMFVYGRAKKDLSANTDEYVENVMKVIELSDMYGVRYGVNILPLKVTTKFCGAGNMIVLLENGLITTCLNAVGNDKASKFFAIGEYNEKRKRIELDEKKRVLVANRTVDKIKECKNCILKWNCGGGCPLYAFPKHNTIFSVDYDCDARRFAFEKFVHYKIQREFMKIKPALEIVGKNLYYSMVFNKFKLYYINDENVKPNSFIKISGKTNLDTLVKNIINVRNLNGYKTSIFLLSFSLSEENLNRNFGNKIVKFLEELKKNRIFFVVTKPICRQLFGENYNKILNKFKIPRNWFEAVELFRLRGSKAVLKNGKIVEIKNSTKRENIYRKFKEDVANDAKLPFKKCKFCIYRIRKNCEYFV